MPNEATLAEHPHGVKQWAPASTHALITHLHPDHYDREFLLRLAPSGTVGCHTPIAADLARDGITAIPQELGRPRQIGRLTVTPVASLDWRGTDSDQVAWIVEGAGSRIIHCGDTMWHGNWWQIARDHGPFDIAFVPVNGVIAKFEGYEANVPVTLTPEQAVEAAAMLQAEAVCAIHYELFDNPPFYVEQRDIAERLRHAAERPGNRTAPRGRRGKRPAGSSARRPERAAVKWPSRFELPGIFASALRG